MKMFSTNYIADRVKLSFMPCLLLVLNLLYFGTFSIYQTNLGEFQISYIQVATVLLLPSLGLLLVLLTLDIVLPSRLRKLYVASVLVLGILTYAQGNILLWDYGVLDGTDLDFTNDWRAWVDGAIWLLLFIAVFTYHQRFINHTILISSVLILIQITAVSITSMQFTVDQNISKQIRPFPDSLGQFSRKGNFIHLILDAFQADIFEELLSENPKYSNFLSGFTFFRDATTSSAVTYLSVPASLSGKIFRNDRTISAYQEHTLGGENLYSLLSRYGYEVDVATAPWWNKPNDSFSSYFRIPATYSTKNQTLSSSLTIVDLSLFRQVPHFLKSLVYNSQTWFLSSIFSPRPDLRFEHFAHNAFLTDLSKGMSVTDRPPVYKFIHLVTPHAPMVSDKMCSFPGYALSYNRSNFKQQALCTMLTVEIFLESLRENGIYDSSVILIHGDHGGGVPFSMHTSDGQVISSIESKFKLWGAPLPLVLVKPVDAKAPLHISNSQVQLSDIPATVSSLLGLENNFPGQSMYDLQEDKTIERLYFWSDMHRNDAAAKDFFDHLYTYVIRGSVYDEDSWSTGDVLRSNRLDERAPYQWDSLITFGNLGTSKLFQVKGWSTTSSDYITWNGGEFAVLALDIPKPTTDVELIASVKPFIAPGKLNHQRVGVFVAQQKVGEWLVTKRDFHEERIRIPKEYFGKGGLTELRFVFHDAESPFKLGVSKDVRKLGLAFRSIRLTMNRIPMSEIRDAQPLPVVKMSEEYKWGTNIIFGRKGNAEAFKGEGWSHPNTGHEWNNGHRTSLHFRIEPPTSDIIFEAKLIPYIRPKIVDKQRIQVLVNGRNLAEWIPTEYKQYVFELKIPKELMTSPELTVSFELPDAVVPASINEGNDKRTIGIAVNSIRMYEAGIR